MGENAGELGRLYVLSEAQGTGLGRVLLEGALNYLTRAFDEVYLSVYAENFRAQKIYAGRGFRKIHDYFYMVGGHADPEWIMRLAPDIEADEFGRPTTN
jgi:ribosomal protein S18 acetylase RimI-like enzyme